MRPWAWALVGSFCLHALVAAVVSAGRSASPPPVAPHVAVKVDDVVFTRVGLARLPSLAPAPVSVHVPVLPSPRVSVLPAPGLPGKAEGTAPRDEEAPVVAPVGEGDAVGGSPHPDPLPSGGEGEGGGAAPAAPEAPTAGAGAQAAGGVDVVALVHARLAAVADGCYPPAARRFQQRGTVELAFCADARGAPTGTAVTRSSGAALLDDAAKGCVLERAAPLPPEAASHCFTVPVRFGAR